MTKKRVKAKMNHKLYYFDTSIWLDLFEDRDEPNFPKSQWAKALVNKIIRNNDKIIYSNANLRELIDANYSFYEIRLLFEPLSAVLIFIRANKYQLGKSKDLSHKRKIPWLDALHAILARDTNAILVTFDHHFNNIKDIAKPYRTDLLI